MATRSRHPRGRLRPPEPDTEDLSDPTTCPDCDTRPRPDGIDVVCPECGLVLSTDAIDRGPEWGVYDRDTRARTGPPRDHTRHDRGLGTVIRGRELPYRQRRLHKRTSLGSKADRARAYVYGELRRVADRTDQPDVIIETAGQLFEAAHETGLATGRSLDGLAMAAFAAAARVHDAPVTRADVLEYGRTDRQTLASCYDALNRELDAPIPPPSPRVLVGRVCAAVDVAAGVRTDAEAAVDAADTQALAGRNPWSVAAAAVYLAAGGSRNGTVTQAEVGDAAGVTANTVRKTAALMAGDGDG